MLLLTYFRLRNTLTSAARPVTVSASYLDEIPDIFCCRNVCIIADQDWMCEILQAVVGS